MSKRKPVPITPLRELLLHDAHYHGNALIHSGQRRATGLMRAFQILCRGGLLDPETGGITPEGLEVLRAIERQRAA